MFHPGRLSPKTLTAMNVEQCDVDQDINETLLACGMSDVDSSSP